MSKEMGITPPAAAIGPPGGQPDVAAPSLIGEEFGYDDLRVKLRGELLKSRPMDILLSRLTVADGERLATAVHETTHALSAVREGFSDALVRISVIRRGNRLGYTQFSRTPNAAVIGASIPLADGGDAGDRAQLRAMAGDGDASVFIGAAAADGYQNVQSFHPFVRDCLALGIARFGVVDGDTFFLLKRQAEWEQQWFVAFPGQDPDAPLNAVSLRVPEEHELAELDDEPVALENGWTHELFDGGQEKFTRYENWEIVETTERCSFCKSSGDHLPDCPYGQKEGKEQTLQPTGEQGMQDKNAENASHESIKPPAYEDKRGQTVVLYPPPKQYDFLDPARLN